MPQLIVAIRRVDSRPESEWQSLNPVLEQNVGALNQGTLDIKIGDGKTRWSDLEYGILRDSTAPHNHAHRSGGRDPITPEDIGAAASEHTHQIEAIGIHQQVATFTLDAGQSHPINLDLELGDLRFVQVGLKFLDADQVAAASSVAYWYIHLDSRILTVTNTYSESLTFYLLVTTLRSM